MELWDGRRLPGKIVNRDRRRDLAVIQIEASDLPAATPGDSNALRVGELVIAVGNPLGFIGAASTGVVHGFPFINSRPFVGCQPVAIGSWKLRRTAGERSRRGGWDQHHDPYRTDRGRTRVCDSFLFSGEVPEYANKGRSGLGVVVRPVLVDRAARQLGLIVLEVIPQSPADRASLLEGDILVGAGDETIPIGPGPGDRDRREPRRNCEASISPRRE